MEEQGAPPDWFKVWTESQIRLLNAFPLNWMHFFAPKTETTGPSLEGWTDYVKAFGLPPLASPEAWEKTFEAGNAYLAFCRQWGQGFKELVEQISKRHPADFEGETARLIADAWRRTFKELADLLFNQFVIAPLWHLLGPSLSLSGLIPLLMPQVTGATAAWQEMMTKNFPWQEMSQPRHYQALQEMGLRLYQETLGKMTQAPFLGPARETLEKYSKDMNALATACLRLQQGFVEFIGQIYAKWTESQLAAAHKILTGWSSGTKRYDDLYQIWIGAMEETFGHYLESKEFAPLFGNLMGEWLEVRGHRRRVMDDLLGIMDMPCHRDLDEVNRSLHQLKREVRLALKGHKEGSGGEHKGAA